MNLLERGFDKMETNQLQKIKTLEECLKFENRNCVLGGGQAADIRHRLLDTNGPEWMWLYYITFEDSSKLWKCDRFKITRDDIQAFETYRKEKHREPWWETFEQETAEIEKARRYAMQWYKAS
jgi:hypothetical protein